MAKKKKVGSSWQKLTGTGPYTDPSAKSSWNRLTGTGHYAKGQAGYKAPKSGMAANNALGPKAAPIKSSTKVSAKAPAKSAYSMSSSPKAPVATSIKAASVPSKVSSPVSRPAGRKTASTPATKRSMSGGDLASFLGLSSDSAVTKRLKARAATRKSKPG